ncbi:hypothetical protein MB818_19830 [Ruegeria sp. 1NDH52C]|uniref:Restriction endonuclease type IV Mrr domain-containing protein n=1 Tax=Ruegeria alba TaxID=2916756 RepID=A0ABS9P1U8_9RHOB|nr:hypothetical protein [Ruegeria alba]MCG6560465.1 hypothetical protein [Ruegeria alba]
MAIDYPNVFKNILGNSQAAGKSISLQVVLSDPRLSSVRTETSKKHLKSFISQNTQYIGVVEGLLPDDRVLIHIIEARIGGKINEANVVSANRECAEIVKSAAKPVLKTYVQETLSGNLNGNQLRISVADLIDFLLDEYEIFSRGAGNSLVSTAGRMNEKLLMECLKGKGLIENRDFTRTGTKSDADIIIHSSAGAKPRLGVEVKSYHARERLLRGLKDVTGPKVGAGYFVDEKEFNESHTQALIQANAAAVYLPQQTLAKIDQKIRDMRAFVPIAVNSRFYRPIESFASDMSEFCVKGKLPTI